jgi:flagellar basal-body rod modification protein FlgD
MMNTKMTTKAPVTEQTWKPQQEKSATPQELQELLGGKDLGTFLNEITDPNYVDPKKMRRTEGKMDKEGFLKLLLTQLRYQDPMNPMESHEMAAQLAQFSTLEQMSNINSNIEGLAKAQTPVQNYQALNFIGKTIHASTDKILRNRGDTNHELRFTIPNAAKELDISIMDETGAVVKTIKAVGLKKGENKVVWNGTKEDGYPAFSGNYTFSVKGRAENGSPMVGQTHFSGVVTGMNFSPEGPILMVGDQKVRISDVKNIENQNEKFAQEIREQNNMAVEKKAPTSESAQAQPQGAPERSRGNIDLVPMSAQLKENIAKETTGT